MRSEKLGPKLWGPDELADYLGVAVSWIYKRTRKDGPEAIPHIKLGKYIRFDPESAVFQTWLANHEVGCEGTDGLTLPFTVNTVRATEGTGQVQ
jgi:hypothetical protein